jgi:ribosomal protein L7/L12
MPAQFTPESIAAHIAHTNRRLQEIEDHLALVSQKVGVPYTPPTAGAPAEVRQLAQAGKTIDAIKRYRELTGASFEDARGVVMGL